MNDPIKRTEIIEAEVELSDAERLQKGKELAKLVAERVSLEDEKRAVASDFTARLKKQREEIMKVNSAVRTGKMDVPVECTIQYNDRTFEREWVDADGNVRQREQLTTEEVVKLKQGELFDDAPAELN